MDCYDYLHVNNPKARDTLLDIIRDDSLIDCWRDLNLEKKEFTWFRKNTNKKGRLDFFLISESVMTFVEDAKIMSGYRTDHSIISLMIYLDKFVKGSTYWKMNNSLLKDPFYVQLIKETNIRTKHQYIEPGHIFGKYITELSNEGIQFNIDDQLFF